MRRTAGREREEGKVGWRGNTKRERDSSERSAWPHTIVLLLFLLFCADADVQGMPVPIQLTPIVPARLEVESLLLHLPLLDLCWGHGRLVTGSSHSCGWSTGWSTGWCLVDVPQRPRRGREGFFLTDLLPSSDTAGPSSPTSRCRLVGLNLSRSHPGSSGLLLLGTSGGAGDRCAERASCSPRAYGCTDSAQTSWHRHRRPRSSLTVPLQHLGDLVVVAKLLELVDLLALSLAKSHEFFVWVEKKNAQGGGRALTMGEARWSGASSWSVQVWIVVPGRQMENRQNVPLSPQTWGTPLALKPRAHRPPNRCSMLMSHSDSSRSSLTLSLLFALVPLLHGSSSEEDAAGEAEAGGQGWGGYVQKVSSSLDVS